MVETGFDSTAPTAAFFLENADSHFQSSQRKEKSTPEAPGEKNIESSMEKSRVKKLSDRRVSCPQSQLESVPS